jgi:hypothetical protein
VGGGSGVASLSFLHAGKTPKNKIIRNTKLELVMRIIGLNLYTKYDDYLNSRFDENVICKCFNNCFPAVKDYSNS